MSMVHRNKDMPGYTLKLMSLRVLTLSKIQKTVVKFKVKFELNTGLAGPFKSKGRIDLLTR